MIPHLSVHFLSMSRLQLRPPANSFGAIAVRRPVPVLTSNEIGF